MLLLDVIKEITALTKEKIKEKAYRTQLMKSQLNVDAFEYMLKRVDASSDLVIELQMDGGNKITIKRENNKNNTTVKSFREKFEDLHK